MIAARVAQVKVVVAKVTKVTGHNLELSMATSPIYIWLTFHSLKTCNCFSPPQMYLYDVFIYSVRFFFF